MSIRAALTIIAMLGLAAPVAACADEIDTEHLFGFMIGSDIGRVGEREFETRTGARLSRNGGHYRAFGQEFELEFVPMQDFRVELGTSFAAHDIGGVAGLADRRQAGWQGLSVDLRYRFLDREHRPFGMTLAVEADVSRIEDGSGAPARSHGTGITLAFDRELIPGTLVAALNLSYQPEWTRLNGTLATERDSTIGVAGALMAQLRPGFYLGGEARYLRAYEGIGLQEFSGDALFIGPTAYLQFSPEKRLTVAWSTQAWGRDGSSPGRALNLTGFERHQARLIYGVNF
ncbi:hypothetical protein [Tardiphaga sp.]|uniref:hypothetical protein n=1 Tax=Tardiphaga sp. TaxID=1926292 RepID=UPI00260C6ED5|nr:hypothetical protein [Tardiphaga sp.]MDB5619366.1 hypothetical protein [Tardiphaga sp.]